MNSLPFAWAEAWERLLWTLSNDDDDNDGSENATKKNEFAFFQS